MSQSFFIVYNGNQKGPFTYEELHNQQITAHTLVWTEGLIDWTRAGSVAILKDIIVQAPPPIPGQEKNYDRTIPPTPFAETKLCFGYELARRRDRLFASLIETIIIFTPWIMIFGWEDNSDMYDFESVGKHALFSVIYGAILYPLFSGNLGHKIMGLKVISSENGSDQKNAGMGALREGLKSVLSIFIIPLMWLLWDEKIQNLYDKAVKTFVVKVK